MRLDYPKEAPMRLMVTVGVIGALAALTMPFGRVAAAATTTGSVTTTCTFDPNFQLLSFPAGKYHSVKTVCATVWTSTTFDDPVCISGELWVFGIGEYAYLENWYSGRAVRSDLDGVAVATADPADIVIPGAHWVDGSGFSHTEPLGHLIGTC